MRGMFGRMMGGAAQQRGAAIPTTGAMPTLGSIPSTAGVLVSQSTSMTVSAVYAAVTTIATDVARCRGTLHTTASDGSRTAVTQHPVADLLRRPNRVQTWFEFSRDLFIAYLLRGNGYAVALRAKNGDVRELILVNPDAVTMLESQDGELFYNVSRMGLFQIAALQDYGTSIPAEDVFHLRGPSFNMLTGMSTLLLARDSIGLAMAQSQQQSRWMGNGAKPSVILETPRQLTEEAARRLKASWNEYTSGIQNVGKTAVLENGITAKPLLLTSVDLQFIDQANLTIQDIARFFGVPTRKLAQPDTTRGSTIIQEEQAYVNSTVSPKLDMFEQKFERFFDLDKEGMELDMNEDALLRTDPLTRYNLGRIGKLSGLISTNEWRRGERLPPDPNGDVLMQPVNMAAIGSDMSGQAPDGAGAPASGHMPAEGASTKNPTTAPEDDVAPEG